MEDDSAVALIYKLQLELGGYFGRAAPVRALVLAVGATRAAITSERLWRPDRRCSRDIGVKTGLAEHFLTAFLERKSQPEDERKRCY